MGNTLERLQGGSARIAFTVLIEGYRYILTDADPAAAVAAHSGSAHVGALGGLFVQLENEQALSPWNPFPSGGTCTLTIAPDEDDTFGIDTHRRAGGAETELSTTAERNTGIFVKSTTGFPASGDAFCGTECFEYDGLFGGTTFSNLLRGKYAAFSSSTWAEHHRVGAIDGTPKLEPIVSQYPRRWQGKWVGVFVHNVTGDGTLDTLTEAQLVYAGKIAAISDDPETGGTVVELRHVLDIMREQTIGTELWSGRLAHGVNLSAGEAFSMKDHNGVSLRTANDLEVVSSGAAGANQINAGYYTHEQITSALNTWTTSEASAGRLHGVFNWGVGESDGALRTRLVWRIAASSTSTNVYFEFLLPWRVSNYLGITPQTDGGNAIGQRRLREDGAGSTEISFYAYHPIRLLVFDRTGVQGQTKAQIVEERGTFYNNYPTFPSALRPGPSSDEFGIFLVNESILVWAQMAADRSELINVVSLMGSFGTEPLGTLIEDYAIDADAGNVSTVSVRQIVMIEMQFYRALLSMIYSTGTAGYNHTTWDTLGYGLGLGIPREILGSDFILEAQHLPGAYQSQLIVIDKPMRFSDLFAGELMLRFSFLRWIDGRLGWCQWRTPLAGHASFALEESNKAAPAGTRDSHRTGTREDDEWMRNVVKILYNRDVSSLGRGESGYRSTFILEDRVSIDDAGGEGTAITISCRNTYSQFANTGDGVEALAPGFLAVWPMFSRPVLRLSRSIDARFFEGMAIGDCVTITDLGARDPDTGERGISARPAIVVRHWYSFGGKRPGGKGVEPMDGGIDLLLLDSNRAKMYGPAAQLDDTASSSGFTAGYDSATNTIRCYSHKHSETTEDSDATYFAAGYEVTIIEIDPADPAAPQSWSRSISSVSGDDITLAGSTLSGFDSTKKYRVVYGQFDVAAEAQKDYAYQADDADALIDDAAPPHQYSGGWPAPTYTANADSDPIELPPDTVSADAISRDCAHDLALIRLLNNLDDRKLAISSPFLCSTIGSHPVGSGRESGYKLVFVRPIFLTQTGLTTSLLRSLFVAPWFRSSTGASTTCRVTIARQFPTGSSVYDVDRGSDYADVSFATTSTTWATPTEEELDIGRVKPSDGVVWLLIELTGAGETRGLARCSEGPRTTS